MLLRSVWQVKFPKKDILYAHTHFDRIQILHDLSRAARALNEEVLRKAIRRSWNRETSDDPERWSRRNPARGQCAVTAMIVQDFFGGELLCGYINLTPHYWNLLPDGCELDLTKDQFEEVVISGATVKSTRQFVLSFPETRRHYKRLRKLVLAALNARDYPGNRQKAWKSIYRLPCLSWLKLFQRYPTLPLRFSRGSLADRHHSRAALQCDMREAGGGRLTK
jgi:hypothetical protein